MPTSEYFDKKLRVGRLDSALLFMSSMVGLMFAGFNSDLSWSSGRDLGQISVNPYVRSLVLPRFEENMRTIKENARAIALIALVLAPAALLSLPSVQRVFADSLLGPRNPNVIATTLAFKDGKVVTVQYSNIYFCNSAGPATSSSSSPCTVGVDATVAPIPDIAVNTLDVIVPAFLHPLCVLASITCASSNSVFDPTLGANNFAQCPDNTSALTCPNHPMFLDLTPLGLKTSTGQVVGVVPLPIHSHILSGGSSGWWELRVWLVTDPRIWPNPSTGNCSAGTGCLTSAAALAAAGNKVVGPVPTTIYLFFNVVSTSAV